MRTPTTRRRTCALCGPLRLPLLLLCACACALVLPGAAAASGPLHDGSKGPRVAVVQKVLHQRVDRLFGPATGRAVERLQRGHEMTADGVVGPRTWALVKRLRARQRARAPRTGGFRGSARVARLQRTLGLTPDGIFGPVTARAVVLRARARPGGLPLRVRRIVAAADRIASMPYRYGGGHGNWHDSGYDCSGSVSFALHGAGLLGTALDSGRFMGWGDPGPGRWVTVYAKPSHAYMVVAGRRFDTSGSSATRWQADLRTDGGYVARHPRGL
jgi:peptidoglycan hydrolase-like protein with peptidoglycan-binding domain